MKPLKILEPVVTLLAFTCICSFFLPLDGLVTANSLEEVDDKELQKLLNQEAYVAVLFSKLQEN